MSNQCFYQAEVKKFLRMTAKPVLCMMILGLACCSKPKAADPAEVAGRAAKLYYEYLLKGDYASFIDGCYRPEQIPSNYREQLTANAKMYVGQMNKEHDGMKSVSIIKSEADTLRHTANVFLNVVYGDSTREQILVPMVEYRNNWYMR